METIETCKAKIEDMIDEIGNVGYMGDHKECLIGRVLDYLEIASDFIDRVLTE